MTTQSKLQIIVRPATPEDYPDCLELDRTSSSHYVWQVEADDRQDRMTYSFRAVRLPRETTFAYPQTTDSMLASWAHLDYFVVAVDHTGKTLGYLNARIDHAYRIAWVQELVVDRPWRRRQVGTALLKKVQGWASANKMLRLTLEIQTKNYPAIAFCQRHGLSMCGFNDRYYPNRDIALFFSQNLR
jgi:GNAT superfamily N-acetyltransferase